MESEDVSPALSQISLKQTRLCHDYQDIFERMTPAMQNVEAIFPAGMNQSASCPTNVYRFTVAMH